MKRIARIALFRIHWFAGLVAGTLLIVIALSGATLAFREEIVDAINPGGRAVPPSSAPMLSPPQLLRMTATAFPQQPIGTIAIFAKPGAAVRILFEPPKGAERGRTLYLDPYTGRPLPLLKGADFFEWVESLHRWLLLKRDIGRVATGILVGCLLTMLLTGLYLRWPKRRALRWRAWFTIDAKIRGRPFLRALHALIGTIALPALMLTAVTGLYWAFDGVRDRVDAMVGEARATRPAAPRVRAMARGDSGSVDIEPAWQTFERLAATPGWHEVIVRVTSGVEPAVLFTWLAADPPHERARNRLTVQLPTGDVVRDERYRNKPFAARLVASNYALHLGSYFGWAGRILMFLSALSLPFFAVTGWMLYLARRRQHAAHVARTNPVSERWPIERGAVVREV